MILTIRTDKPEAEIGLYDGQKQVAYHSWQAHRELSKTLLAQVEKLLHEQNGDWGDISGIVFFEGPGSFTGLRIGAAFVNALSIGNSIPSVQSGGIAWIVDGIVSIEAGNSHQVAPVYSESARTSKPRK